MVCRITRHVPYAEGQASSVVVKLSDRRGPQPTTIRPGPNPKRPWSQENDLDLMQRWSRNETVETISTETGRTRTDVKRQVVFLRLPRRRDAQQKKNVKVNVDDDTYRMVGIKARRAGKTIAAYIRRLIVEDIYGKGNLPTWASKSTTDGGRPPSI